jgi:hypothetical protein
VLWHASDSVAGSPVAGGGHVRALDQNGGVLPVIAPEAQIDTDGPSGTVAPVIAKRRRWLVF